MSSNTQIPQSLKKSVEETKVEYVKLGKSGLKVSVPILGAMSFGSPDWAPWVRFPRPLQFFEVHANATP
jgi:hypothetical protein